MQNSGKNRLVKMLEGKPARVFPFFMVLMIWASLAQGQIHEVGVSLGATNHVGDLVRTYQLRNHVPAGALLYRYNLNHYASLRANLMLSKFTGSDDPAYDAFGEARNRGKFSNWMNEAAVLFEYNFLDYKNPAKDLVRWSPYFVTGLGMLWVHGYDRYEEGMPAARAYAEGRKTAPFSSWQPVIPIGMGIKYRLTPMWTLSGEWSARKTFFDYIDNTGALPEGQTAKNYQYGNINHKDWYFFTGISLSYTFWTIPCPYLFDNKPR
jgi:hypothetical protein